MPDCPAAAKAERRCCALLAIGESREDLALLLQRIGSFRVRSSAPRRELPLRGWSDRRRRLAPTCLRQPRARSAARSGPRARSPRPVSRRGRSMRGAEQLAHAVLPRRCVRLNVFQARTGLRVFAPGNTERARVGLRGLVGVTLIGQHIAQLEQERAHARPWAAGASARHPGSGR